MKIGIVGFGNRIAHVFLELKKINSEATIVAFVDPKPIGKNFAEQNNFFPSKQYDTLNEMLKKEKLDLLMVGSPNYLHIEHIQKGLEEGVKIFAEKPIVINEEQTWKLAELIQKYGKEKVLVGLVLRYSKHARSLKELIDNDSLGKIISLEASEHIMPWHGGFFMRNWRRKTSYSGGFMLEKCCHDLDFYSLIVGCRPIKVASFGGRRSFIPENSPALNDEKNLDIYKEYNLEGWESKEQVFDSDADIVDHQVAIIEYENGATLAFHTNMKVPDEFRRFAIIGTKGMAEGDFVRGYLTAHNSYTGEKIFDENFGAAFQQNTKGHYGADQLMVKDINNYLLDESNRSLPVDVVDCMEAGLVAMKIDESRVKKQIIDLREMWNKLDSYSL
jgi:predicted dehydrogenase|tara:strand:+ start:1526 stop:2689 length:1164 start_codon:yes stop_codon:yes gene_type:complete